MPIIFFAFATIKRFSKRHDTHIVCMKHGAFPSLSRRLEEADTKQPKLQEICLCGRLQVFASICGIFAGVFQVMLVELL